MNSFRTSIELPTSHDELPQVSCANLLKLLADETRLAVVRQLMDRPKHVGEINESLGLEQSLLSHHLKILRESGLVKGQRDGKAVLYSLSSEFLATTQGDALDLGCCQISFDQQQAEKC